MAYHDGFLIKCSSVVDIETQMNWLGFAVIWSEVKIPYGRGMQQVIVAISLLFLIFCHTTGL